MSLEPIRNEVRNLLAFTNADIEDAEAAMDHGDDRSRVEAAGNLAYLRPHKAMLEARLAELRHAHDGAGETFIQWVKESWMLLVMQAETWLIMH